MSYNLGVDTSLMLLGLSEGATTLNAAQAVESRILASQFGIPAADLHFLDGSGGGFTTATNEAITTLLARMKERPSYAPFLDALPRLGVDGSLANASLYKQDPSLIGATGKVHAKTGTFVDGSGPTKVLKVMAQAGYIQSRSGRLVAYTLAINDFGTISGIEDIHPVGQDLSTIAAMLWKSQ